MGESARKPGAPTLPLTPEELLTAGPGEGYSWIEKNVPPLIVAGCLAAGAALNNWRLRRPFFTGIYTHISMGAIGYVVGDWFFKKKREQKSEKNAILLHYMSLHPEDFPPFERQRFKDLFLDWVPRR